MKKILTIVLILAFALNMVSCGEKENKPLDVMDPSKSLDETWTTLDGELLVDTVLKNFHKHNNYHIKQKVYRRDKEPIEIEHWVQGKYFKYHENYDGIDETTIFTHSEDAEKDLYFVYDKGDKEGNAYDEASWNSLESVPLGFEIFIDYQIPDKENPWDNLRLAKVEVLNGEEVVYFEVANEDKSVSKYWFLPSKGMYVKYEYVNPEGRVMREAEVFEAEVDGDYTDEIKVPKDINFYEICVCI